MTSKQTGAAVVCAALSMAGCMGHFDLGDDEGSGVQAKKDFELTGFEKVSTNGSMDVTVTVGEKESIKVEGDESRVKNFEARVEDGTLVLEEKSTFSLGSKGDLKVTVTVPKLTAFSMNGSGDATVTGIGGGSFSTTINGSGDVELAGAAASASIAVNGSGDVQAKGLKAKKASVSIAGSGNVETTVSDSLTVSVAGSGDVTYFGSPQVSKSVLGSGEVTKG